MLRWIFNKAADIMEKYRHYKRRRAFNKAWDLYFKSGGQIK